MTLRCLRVGLNRLEFAVASLLLVSSKVQCLSPPTLACRSWLCLPLNMVNTEVEGERAGTSGYSVLRQPVKWDPDKDPTFDAPSTLREQDEQRLDESWLNERTSKRQSASTKKAQGQSPAMTKAADSHEELDLFQRTLDTLDYPVVLSALENECITVPGRTIVVHGEHTTSESKRKRSKRQRDSKAFMPLTATSFEGSQERYRAVKEMQWLSVEEGSNELRDAHWRNRKGYKEGLGPPPLQGMSFNLKSILDMVDNGQVLEGPEILEVSTMLDVLEDVSLWTKGLTKVDCTLKFEELPKLGDCITVNSTLQELLHNAFDDNGRLSGTTFPAIGRLRAKVRTLKGDILNRLDTLLGTPSVKSKVAMESGGALYSEINGRIVIPIDEKVNNKASVGIVHDASRSGKTVYVEPTQIVGPTNELRQAEGELRAEEARVWRLLSEQILLNRNVLEESVAAVGQLDLVMARVLLGKKLGGVIPRVGNEGIVSLKDAKHPVLLLRDLDVVGSDIDLGSDGNQGLVLTGPNAGGKTVILKLLGLVALMARTGLPVPAKVENADQKPRVDFFNPVLADIGDLQSVGGDLSTFSGHMLVCREVLSNACKNALVLMDELGSGTDPAQGVAIAQALLEALVDTGARVAITTHYLELKQLAASDNRFAVGGMQFVNGRPTYKLLPGTVGESFALAVAERLELPQSVLERANELLDQETRQMGDLIRELEDQKALVDQQVEEMTRKKKEMAEIEAQMRSQQAKLESKQLSARRDEAKKFAKKLEEKERVLEDILEKLKSNPSRKIVAKSWEDVKFVKRDALNDAENVPSVVAQKRKAAAAQEKTLSELVPLAEMREKPDLKVGDKLMVCKKGTLFGKEATISQLSGNSVEVKVSGMAIKLKLTELSLPVQGVVVQSSRSGRGQQQGPKNLSSATEKLLREEKQRQGPNTISTPTKSGSSVSIRTDSNTVDVRGCYMDEAKGKITDKFSKTLMSGRNVVYILHGHGTSGILKTKIRNWLKQERKLVKTFEGADSQDGGDAFTRVELRNPNF